MRINENILDAKKSKITALIVIIAVQSVIAAVMILFNIFNCSGGYLKYVWLAAIILVVIGCIFADIYYWYMSIHKMNKLVHVEPVPCTVEDFIITYTKKNKRIRFHAVPVVRSNIDGKIYVTIGKLNLSWYTSMNISSGHSLSAISIIRQDKTTVNTGDTAHMYISEIVKPDVVINSKNNTVNIGRNKIKFSSKNSLPINIFDKLTYFEGAVDVENNQTGTKRKS